MFIEKTNNLSSSNSQAEKNCRQAIANAGYAFGVPVSFHWSQLNNPNGDKQAAIDAYKTLLVEEENNKSALEGLAFLYQFMGFQHEVLQYRKRLKEIEVDEYGIQGDEAGEVVDYLLAKTGEAEKPSRVPYSFVSSHFDKYADFFDVSLSEELQYIGPQLIQEQIKKYAQLDGKLVNILDLGCGTGLVGQAVSQFSSHLSGVDLSQNMLAKANERGCYDRLTKTDILAYLDTQKAAFDILCAGDVFNYLGDLSSIFKMAKSALTKGGLFIFTIESTDACDFKLCNTGRFKHSPKYLHSLIENGGFATVNEAQIILRKEREEGVKAMIFCLRKTN